MGGGRDQGNPNVSESHTLAISSFGSVMARWKSDDEMWRTGEGRNGGEFAPSGLNSNGWGGGPSRMWDGTDGRDRTAAWGGDGRWNPNSWRAEQGLGG